MIHAFLVVPAVFFLGMGLVALVHPSFIVGIFGIALESPAARGEVRAVYGGFGLAVGGTLVAALVPGASWAHGAAVAVALSLLGMAFGRLVGALVERQPSYPTWAFVGIELALAASLMAWTHFIDAV